MKTVTFARKFRDRVSALHTIVYPEGWTGKVSDETARLAEAAKALKP